MRSVVTLLSRTVVAAVLLFPLISCDGHVQAVPNPVDFHAQLTGSTTDGFAYLTATPTVKFSGPGVIGGHDAANFSLVGPTPTGDWDKPRQEMIRFRFTPTHRGVFQATYTTTTTSGTMDVIELTGLGAHDVEVDALEHLIALPDGLDFGAICFGRSKSMTFTAVNKSQNDEDVIAYFDPRNPAFTRSPPLLIETITKSRGTLTWTITYKPQSATASDSIGFTVRTWPNMYGRTGVRVRGQGRKCRPGEP